LIPTALYRVRETPPSNKRFFKKVTKDIVLQGQGTNIEKETRKSKQTNKQKKRKQTKKKKTNNPNAYSHQPCNTCGTHTLHLKICLEKWKKKKLFVKKSQCK
jgi:hypothetical protein